jgi:hypothetical protein
MKTFPLSKVSTGVLGFLTSLLLILSGCRGSASEDPDMAMFLPEALGEWTQTGPPVTYDRETIFDYINGAGEVYRSYAFRSVGIAEYEGPESQAVRVEVFDMGTPEDAFGVFSYAREQEDEGIGAGYERKGSILCFWQDRFYACVAAERVEGDPGSVLEEVAGALSESMPPGGEQPALVQALPPEGLVPFSDRFFHTHQSLNYHYYLVRENILNLTPETDAVLARYQPGPTYLLMIDYGDPSQAAAGATAFGQNFLPGSEAGVTVEVSEGKHAFLDRKDQFVVVVLDAPSGSAAEELGTAAREGLAQLAF